MSISGVRSHLAPLIRLAFCISIFAVCCVLAFGIFDKAMSLRYLGQPYTVSVYMAFLSSLGASISLYLCALEFRRARINRKVNM